MMQPACTAQVDQTRPCGASAEVVILGSRKGLPCTVVLLNNVICTSHRTKSSSNPPTRFTASPEARSWDATAGQAPPRTGAVHGRAAQCSTLQMASIPMHSMPTTHRPLFLMVHASTLTPCIPACHPSIATQPPRPPPKHTVEGDLTHKRRRVGIEQLWQRGALARLKKGATHPYNAHGQLHGQREQEEAQQASGSDVVLPRPHTLPRSVNADEPSRQQAAPQLHVKNVMNVN